MLEQGTPDSLAFRVYSFPMLFPSWTEPCLLLGLTSKQLAPDEESASTTSRAISRIFWVRVDLP
jgi:hypothetical protein